MQQHGAYWRQAVERGDVVAFGMVADPACPFGIGIVELDDPAAARRYTDADPIILAGRGFRYDILPMPFGVVHR